MPKPKTIRVRIAVMVNADGKWAASGYSEADDERKSDITYDMMSDHEADNDTLHWIEAEVPLPEKTTIEGTVKPR